MGCVCATYEVNRSKKARSHGADTTKNSKDPWDIDFDRLTWKWGAIHRHLGPVSLRLMTSQFKDIVTHTQKLKTVKCIFCGVWIKIFVWNYKGALWNFTQNFEPIHRKICILRGVKIWRLTISLSYDILSLSETGPWWVVFVIHIKWLDQLDTEPRRGHIKNFKRPVGFSPRNDALPITISRDSFVLYMKQIGYIDPKPWQKPMRLSNDPKSFMPPAFHHMNIWCNFQMIRW